ncbi:VOC family protein [Nocardioides aurantiacus]|uniref:Putative pterin-4-alpha-carbinolamine dehydratase n=1 Tax=Nocardioides aurantiacus TaxID=86796 RepID=A0A3N2CYF3_9ACTN|nr:VOC family protein [Nocardioides aurantiacus]ROR92224.1 4a-hydroxytetrahydrobiopterin dehydratase [Nocardioides aurantiacus]
MAISEQDRQPLRSQEVSDGLPDGWRLLLGQVVVRYATGDFTTGARLVKRVAELADEADHHPDVDLRYPHVTVGLSSHDVGAVTRRDLRLAAAIAAAATELGVEPGQVPDTLELALDTADQDRVAPFYAALLGYDRSSPDDVVDPGSRGPSVWFQHSDSSEAGRQCWHLDVRVPHDQAEDRLRAVLGAGGRLVDDERAPAFWVVEDPEGNRSCITTWQARD